MWFAYQWEWKNELGVWTPYTSLIQKALNLLHKKNGDTIVIKATNNQKYLIDIKNEFQCNIKYNTKRPLRKILVPQTGKDKIFFYHYTTNQAMELIIQTHMLKASTSGAKGAGVYLTSLQQGTSDEVLAKNNWGHGGADVLQRLDVAFVFEFDRKLIGTKLHDHTPALKRDVWTHDGDIDLKFVPYHLYERRCNGYWTMFKKNHSSKFTAAVNGYISTNMQVNETPRNARAHSLPKKRNVIVHKSTIHHHYHHQKLTCPPQVTSSNISDARISGSSKASNSKTHSIMVIGVGLGEFNGKYVVDIARNNGWENGKRCYRKIGGGFTGSKHTIHYRGDHFRHWAMCKNYQWPVYYRCDSTADHPPKSGWIVHRETRSTPKVLPKAKNVETTRASSKNRVSSKNLVVPYGAAYKKRIKQQNGCDVRNILRLVLYTWMTWKLFSSLVRSRRKRDTNALASSITSTCFTSLLVEIFINALT